MEILVWRCCLILCFVRVKESRVVSVEEGWRESEWKERGSGDGEREKEAGAQKSGEQRAKRGDNMRVPLF